MIDIQLLRKNPDAHPGQKDPKVLVKPTTITGQGATEAFFFDAAGALDEVEVRYQPKRRPEESATLSINMDKMFGPHEVTLADDNAYQEAWVGAGTEVRLTYDMRPAVPFGPVITYARRAERAPPKPAPSATATSAGPAGAGKAFGAGVKAAREAGMHLASVEARRGKLALLYQSAGEAREVALTSDPKSGALLGAAAIPSSPQPGAGQPRAEEAIDAALAAGEPVSLTFGSGALEGKATLTFAGGAWITLDPKAPDALAGSGGK